MKENVRRADKPGCSEGMNHRHMSGRHVLGFCPGAVRPEGWLQLAPPSVLRQIPPSFTARYCGWAVAITMSGFNDEIATSTVLKLGNPSRCCQLAPPSKVRKRPPVSVATTIRLSLFDATAIDEARPPCSTLGGVIVTGVGLQPARTASAANPAAIGGRRRSTRAFSQKSIDPSSKRRRARKWATAFAAAAQSAI